MQDAQATVVAVIERLLRRREKAQAEVTDSAELTADLGLDSLELAELSAMLEEELGRDPYSEGIVPRTVGEVIAFYQS